MYKSREVLLKNSSSMDSSKTFIQDFHQKSLWDFSRRFLSLSLTDNLFWWITWHVVKFLEGKLEQFIMIYWQENIGKMEKIARDLPKEGNGGIMLWRIVVDPKKKEILNYRKHMTWFICLNFNWSLRIFLIISGGTYKTIFLQDSSGSL